MEGKEGLFVIDRLGELGRWASLGERFAAAARFLAAGGLDALSPGRHAISGEDVFVNCDLARYVPRGERRFELHRRFLDVHVPLTCDELVGLAPADGADSVAGFDDGRDVGFANSAPGEVWRVVPVGSFCIVWPGACWHAPAVSPDGVAVDARKLVVKVLA